MSWLVPRMWEDEDVWILGGGPSVTEQFNIPDEIVQSVMDRTSPPSVYSPYMKAIHDEHVIGINISFMIGDWMDIIFFGDNGFFMRYQEGLSKYPGLRVTCSSIQTARNVPWIKALDKDTEHVKGISRHPGKVSWNGNSGAAAISLAAHTGAKRIILLGFDMTLNSNMNQHWHDVYQNGKINTQDKLRRLRFDRYLTGFEHIAKDAEQMGIEILNVSPTSKIKEFPKFTLKQLLWDNS